MTVNVAAALVEMARQAPDRAAIHVPRPRRGGGERAYDTHTYRTLDTLSDQLAHGLQKIGIARGTRTVLMVKPSLEFFALTFALMKAGIVPVLVDPGLGLRNLKACLHDAQPEAFIGIPKAHVARILFGWAKQSLKTKVTVGPRLFWGGHSLEEVRRLGEQVPGPALADTGPHELAAILFTSGSTGVPKGVEYQHRHFVGQVEMIRALYDIKPGEIDLPTFPLFALFDPALGMTTVVPDMDASKPASVDPREIFEPIARFGVTNMFGSPAVLDRISRAGVSEGQKLGSLRRVISAGAPVQPQILERMHKLLPEEAEIHTPYGATEALPVSSVGSRFILRQARPKTAAGAGIAVGRPHPSQTVRIIRIDDAPIARWSDSLLVSPGEIGEITVRGPTVTERYYGRPELTALAKIEHDDGGPPTHRMGDLGYYDAEGVLWFCGRKSQRVIAESQLLHTVPIEEILNTHPDVRRTALVLAEAPSGKPVPVVCVERAPDSHRPFPEIRAELLGLADRGPPTKGLVVFLEHPSFPVDVRHNAKIFREKLGPWASAELRKLGPTP
ncbi:MAG: fatty acid CoA ligase family protein [Myxococcota bacterium]